MERSQWKENTYYSVHFENGTVPKKNAFYYLFQVFLFRNRFREKFALTNTIWRVWTGHKNSLPTEHVLLLLRSHLVTCICPQEFVNLSLPSELTLTRTNDFKNLNNCDFLFFCLQGKTPVDREEKDKLAPGTSGQQPATANKGNRHKKTRRGMNELLSAKFNCYHNNGLRKSTCSTKLHKAFMCTRRRVRWCWSNEGDFTRVDF